MLRLAAIATGAGAFSGLFGVGGGTIIVPLLVLWLGYEQKEATGTSLTAIIVIGSLAAATQAVYGNVDLWLGLAIGVPGAIGVVAGTALQQRLSERAVAGRIRGAAGRLGRGPRLLRWTRSTGAAWSPSAWPPAWRAAWSGSAAASCSCRRWWCSPTSRSSAPSRPPWSAIVIVSLVGTWRQRCYGNVRLRDGLVIGVLSPLGVLVGVGLANAVPERALELSFAGVQLLFAWQLAKKAGLR